MPLCLIPALSIQDDPLVMLIIHIYSIFNICVCTVINTSCFTVHYMYHKKIPYFSKSKRGVSKYLFCFPCSPNLEKTYSIWKNVRPICLNKFQLFNGIKWQFYSKKLLQQLIKQNSSLKQHRYTVAHFEEKKDFSFINLCCGFMCTNNQRT